MNADAAKPPPTETLTSAVTTPADAQQAAPTPPPDGGEGTSAEIGGPSGPDPTRFGEWERKGRCIDF